MKKLLGLFWLAAVAACAFAQCPGGYALQFDGADDYVAVSSPFFDGGTTSSFTIECFMKMWDPTQEYGCNMWGKTAYWQEANFNASNGCVSFRYAYSGGYYGAGWPTITLNTWHHVAVCMEGSSIRLFVDGDLASSETTNGVISWAADPGSHRLACGIVSGSPHFWEGCLDEFRVSSIARYAADFLPPRIPFESDSYTEVLYHFDEGDGDILHDASPNGNHGTLISNPQWICSDVPLPVELLSFTAVPAENDIRLSFATASETDNDHFEILRGEQENGEFARIIILPSQGNSATMQRYEYTDTDVNPGQTYWYFLADVDMSGHRSEHRDRIVSAAVVDPIATPTSYSLSVYPNPFNPTTTISFTLIEAGRVNVAVYDVNGRWIQTLEDKKRGAGDYKLTFDARDLPSGVYFVRMESGEFRATRKIVLMK